jgi:hypothetical protein
MPTPLVLESNETYFSSCLRIAQERFGHFPSIEALGQAEDDLNAYPRLDRLEDPRDIRILDPDALSETDLRFAYETVLDGRVFWEHAAAGEATRLKMGAKYLIRADRDLGSLEKTAALITQATGRETSPDMVRARFDADPGNLLPLNLGARHMIQLAYDLDQLARRNGRDPQDVLARQHVLVVLNEKTAETILRETVQARFYGFVRENYLFMIQPAFPGIDLREGRFVVDPDSERRLHNHGQMVMQETMDDQLFRMDEQGRREYLKAAEVRGILEGMRDKVSYNIEDLDYLTGAVDWPGLALALALGREGFHMVMEIVANDPHHPIKGGMAAYDRDLSRNVMVESFQLKGMDVAHIRYLNKNFNHYPFPAQSFEALKENGLFMPSAVKDCRLYFQPVQGDINFLAPTVLVMRRVLKPIRAWKSAVNTPDAVNAMAAQDRLPGFIEFVKRVTGELG